MEDGNPESREQVEIVEETNVESNHEDVAEHNTEDSQEEKTVPLSALKKEKKRRQKLQEELETFKSKQQPQEEDYTKYESVTREELGQSKFEIQREIREEVWAETNPERANYVQEELEDFLKQRPNLAVALQGSGNRLKEAWELMSALQPKREKQKVVQKQDAPRAPGTVPKSAGINETVDVMNMSDDEFKAWRNTKRRRR